MALVRSAMGMPSRSRRVGGAQHPEGGRLQQRAEDALGDAQADHPADTGRQADPRRRGGEAQHADGEDLPVAVPVTEPAGEDEQARHGDEIAGAGPLDLPERGVQIPLHGGLHDGQHGSVQGDDRRPR